MQNVNYRSPVLGRWMTPISPRSSMLAWVEWDSWRIAVALNAMCLPFYHLRAFEFEENKPGKHLRDLNLRHRVVATFVVASVLTAASDSPKLGKKVCTCRFPRLLSSSSVCFRPATTECFRFAQALTKWLDVSTHLETLHNYHMLFAMQNAFQVRPLLLLSAITHRQLGRV